MTRISNKPRNKLSRSAKPETAPGDMAIVQDFVNSKLDSRGNWEMARELGNGWHATGFCPPARN